jgi:hypothetical protein
VPKAGARGSPRRADRPCDEELRGVARRVGTLNPAKRGRIGRLASTEKNLLALRKYRVSHPQRPTPGIPGSIRQSESGQGSALRFVASQDVQTRALGVQNTVEASQIHVAPGF